MAEEVQVVLNHGTILPCEVQGFPRPSITWQREGVPIAAGNSSTSWIKERMNDIFLPKMLLIGLQVTGWLCSPMAPSSLLVLLLVMQGCTNAWQKMKPVWPWEEPNLCCKVVYFCSQKSKGTCFFRLYSLRDKSMCSYPFSSTSAECAPCGIHRRVGPTSQSGMCGRWSAATGSYLAQRKEAYN